MGTLLDQAAAPRCAAPAVAEGGRGGDSRNDVAKPRITGGDRAIVGVVAHVGCDPHEARDLAAAHVDAELRERHDVSGAARRVVADVGVVNERVVLHRVVGRRGPQVARCWHIFHVRLPRTTARLHLVRNVGGIDVTRGAIARDPKGAARREGEVIGQARMGCGVVIRRQAVGRSQAVEIGRV